jgi:hypothetical protein
MHWMRPLLIPLAADLDENDDEYEKKVMTIANQMNCAGCECYTHSAMAVESG